MRSLMVWWTVSSNCFYCNAFCTNYILWYSAITGKDDRFIGTRVHVPPFDICVDARTVYAALSAAYVCEFAEWSLNCHLVMVRDRTAHGLVRKFFCVDARYICWRMVQQRAELTGWSCIVRAMVANMRNVLVHTTHLTAGSATIPRHVEGHPTKEDQ